ncbi:hypothetical protein J6590_098744 [Homalodisca vitripennis]|nr:hypothetical protein J6590_098744 [Homalodisca vitripennis]
MFTRNTLEIHGVPNMMVDACRRLCASDGTGNPLGIIFTMVRSLDAETLLQNRREATQVRKSLIDHLWYYIPTKTTTKTTFISSKLLRGIATVKNYFTGVCWLFIGSSLALKVVPLFQCF